MKNPNIRNSTSLNEKILITTEKKKSKNSRIKLDNIRVQVSSKYDSKNDTKMGAKIM